jgi:uncharacterized protein (TIGR02145 family)
MLKRITDDSPMLYQHANNGVLWGAKAGYLPAKDADLNVKQDGFVKTVYDPCPEGYMIPQTYHFSGLVISNNGELSKSKGALLKCNETDDAYYSMPGIFRPNDTIVANESKTYGFGKNGLYQTSNPYGASGWASSFFRVQYENEALNIKNTGQAQARAMSVRCLKIK